MKPTSALHYLQCIKQFLQHAKDSRDPTCKLNQSDWYNINTTLSILIKSIHRPVVLHQQSSKRAKHEVYKLYMHMFLKNLIP